MESVLDCSHVCVPFQVFADVKAILDKEGWGSAAANYSYLHFSQFKFFLPMQG